MFRRGLVGWTLAAVLSGAAAASAAEFGAIALSQATEAYGYSHNYPSRQAAERAAMNNCRARSSGCRIAIWFYNNCGALAFGDGDGWGAAYESTESRARRSAVNYCRQRTSNCRVEISYCSK